MGESISINVGGRAIRIGTGEIARQAGGAALVQYGETVILATAVLGNPRAQGGDFLPLTVDYRERTYAAGRIPGGFFKRETRPREKETMTSRLTDRTVRPLFAEYIRHEIQVTITVLSADMENDPETIAIVGAGAALALSDIPFGGPVASVTIGRIDGQIVINPTRTQMQGSDLDIVVAGTKNAITMVEGSAREVPEDVVAEGLAAAHAQIKEMCLQVEALAAKAGKPKRVIPAPPQDAVLIASAESSALAGVRDVVRTKEKSERDAKFKALKEASGASLAGTPPDPGKVSSIKAHLEELLYREARALILNESIRTDGRKLTEVRPITSLVGILPRTHGSALFTRGQTQALVTTTLGPPEDQQIMDELEGEWKKRFMLHYNFPAFATGETKPDRSPSRREIGHGMLAERALTAVLPAEDVFPYTLRVVSDILESNGSSSMASVCGGSLSLMDAGVPIKSAVGGVAMGLIVEGGKHAILTDIIGMEDHLGDMDFKVAGTRAGVTAVQMDIKTSGIDVALMKEALAQAHDARLHILGEMDKALSAPRAEMSVHAPRMTVLKIAPKKIGALIGPGGKNIRRICEETGASVDVEDDGRVFVAAVDPIAMQNAVDMVNYYTAEAQVGKIYKGKVVRITNFGAFVEILPGTDGLVRTSELSEKRITRVEEVVKEGDEISVKVLEIDSQGRVNCSKRQADREGAGSSTR